MRLLRVHAKLELAVGNVWHEHTKLTAPGLSKVTVTIPYSYPAKLSPLLLCLDGIMQSGEELFPIIGLANDGMHTQ